MTGLQLGGSCATRRLEVHSRDLAAVAPQHRIPDVSALAPERQGAAVRFAALAELAQPTAAARFVHVESADGSFTANLPLADALAQGLVLYELEGEPLPARFGGPFRLLLLDEADCSVNVKDLARVEFQREPGSHTARCADDE